jgi:hypothetical protein
MLRVIERAFLSKHTIETYNHSGSETIVVLSFCIQRRRKVQLTFRLSIVIKQRVCFRFHALQKRFLCWVKPPTTSLVLGTLTDLVKGKSELIAENALLRQQLIILHRQIKQPVYRKTDRLLLLLRSFKAITKESSVVAVILGRASPDPGIGTPIELSGGDTGGLFNLIIVGKALSGKRITSEEAPPALRAAFNQQAPLGMKT